jgi:tRNA 2-thiouridine synthesizing protein A
MPVIALAKATVDHPNATVTLLSDDPASQHDVPAWCRMKSATLISTESSEGDWTFVIQLPKQG